MEAKRICKKCLLQDMGKEEYAKISSYIDALGEEARVDSKVEERRLGICKECENLLDGTCLKCGCYVEIRAAMKMGRCPQKKW